jgi:two-component system sensor histidine kinase PilS (NtrC family)
MPRATVSQGPSRQPGSRGAGDQASDADTSWFGPPGHADSTLLQDDPPPQPGSSSRPVSGEPSDGIGVTPYFFRVYRAFLTARAALSLILLGVVTALWVSGSALPAWMGAMAATYACLTTAVWWLPSQRVQSTASQSTLRPRQALASVGVDLLFFSLLHHLTGSTVNSQALLVLPVLMAAVLMPRTLALGTAAAATLNLLGAAWLQSVNSGAVASLMTQAGLTGFGLFVIAMLANEMATRLVREERSARGSLELARQQAELNRLVIEEMAEGVMVVDRRGRVRTANPAARRLLSAQGSTPPAPFQLRGVPAWQPLVSAVEKALGSPLQAEGGQEVRLRFDDHAQRELRLRVRFTRSPARASRETSREEMCVMLLEDLRTVKARQRQDKLAAMGRMSAGIAHEIRNPLAAIAQANALLAEDASTPAQQRLTQMVNDNVARLKHIVDDVLTVAPGVRPPAPAIEPVEVVMSICNDWRSTHRLPPGEDSLLEVDVSGCQAQGAHLALKIRFEPDHLQRVLVNLLDNALRYNSGEPGAIQVMLRWLPSASPEGLLMLSVGNDGEPIAAETERALFEPFFSTSSRGTGLGLYISRELCERHGASIDYRQHPPTVRHRNEFFITMQVEPTGPHLKSEPAA